MSMNRPRSRASSVEQLGKEVIALDHGCYICGNVYSTAAYTLNHIRNVHNFNLTPREPSVRRPQDRQYDYVSRRDTNEFDQEHYACPCCWFHCPTNNLEVFYNHTVDVHRPVELAPREDDYDEDMDVGTNVRRKRPSSRNSNRPPSRPSSRTDRRVSIDDRTFSSTNTRPTSRPNSRSGHYSGEREGTNSRLGHYSGDREDTNSRPSSRQSDRDEDISVSGDNRKELSKKMDELRDLFHKLFH